MKILLVPTIREIYSNQLEFCVDKNLIKFLRFSFGSKIKIKIYDGNILKKFNLIILCGGNDLPNIVKKKSNYCFYCNYTNCIFYGFLWTSCSISRYKYYT